MIQSTVWPLFFEKGPKKWHNWREPPLERASFFPQEEWFLSMLQESAGFGDPKQGRGPEIEMFGHRASQQGVQTETRET